MECGEEGAEAGLMDAISYREAKPEDAVPLGALHVASWRETYAGIFPDQLLDGLSAEARATMWHKVLSDPAAFDHSVVFVAERGGELIGFGACGAQRDAALKAQGYDGEIGAVYVLRAHQRAGIGRRLMGLMAGKLLEQGHGSANLWVLRENGPAQAFYERLDGALIGEKAETHSGATRTELAYGWSDLEDLRRRTG